MDISAYPWQFVGQGRHFYLTRLLGSKKVPLMTEDDIEADRDRYIKALTPLFFPKDPISHDIVRYFASLLRIVGMEDAGWDPHLESRALLEDLNSLLWKNWVRRKNWVREEFPLILAIIPL